MDNLTHTAIGLFLSRAGLNRLTPRATAILLLASNAPDASGALEASSKIAVARGVSRFRPARERKSPMAVWVRLSMRNLHCRGSACLGRFAAPVYFVPIPGRWQIPMSV